jgi:hypothetical protein
VADEPFDRASKWLIEHHGDALLRLAGVGDVAGRGKIDCTAHPDPRREGAMSELTLEGLAKRVEALEKAVAARDQARPAKDWRRVVGMFRDSEFMRAVDDECQRMREAEREAARREDLPE